MELRFSIMNTASRPSDPIGPNKNETSAKKEERPQHFPDRPIASPANGTDIFSQFVLSEISRRQEYINLQANRSDQAIQLYLTIASATVGALAVILAANREVSWNFVMQVVNACKRVGITSVDFELS